jgi:hypothetical protein
MLPAITGGIRFFQRCHRGRDNAVPAGFGKWLAVGAVAGQVILREALSPVHLGWAQHLQVDIEF